MVSADASGRKQNRREPGTILPKDFRDPAGVHADREYVASWLGLDRLGIGVEFANQGVSIFLC